jgi:hypothetical protein
MAFLIRGLGAELLCILGGQSLPAAELHGLGADDASDRLTRETPLEDVEAAVSMLGQPRDIRGQPRGCFSAIVAAFCTASSGTTIATVRGS